ncbi:MAG: PAS domain-containing protein [Acetobacteraceae bacterium]|nr:PAS domain-containing protein [Acetobacteraceae bacterium]
MRRLWLLALTGLVGLGILVGGLIVMGLHTAAQRAATTADQAETQEVLLHAQRLLSALQDSETGQRGYLLTGNADYLDAYNSGREEVANELDRLSALRKAGFIQRNRIEQLRAIADAKLGELAHTVQLVQAGNLAEAVAEVKTGSGKLLMDQARQVIGAFVGEETSLLAQRRTAAQEAARRDEYANYGLSVVGILFLVLASTAIVVTLLAGNRLRLASAARQIAETGAHAQRMATLLEAIGASSPNPIYAKDREGRTIYASPATLAIIGKELPEVLGRKATEHYKDPSEAAAVEQNDRHVIENGVIEVVDEALTSPDGTRRIWQSSKSPMRDASGKIIGLVGIATDVTAQRQAERRQRLLLQIADTLRGSSAKAIEAAADLVRTHMSISRVGFGLVDDNEGSVSLIHESTDGTVPRATGTYRIDDWGDEPAELSAGRTLVVNDVTADARTQASRDLRLRRGSRAIIAVPLVQDGHLRALFFVSHREPRAWAAEDVSFVQEVAARSWAVLEQERAEAALQRAAAEFRALADNIPALCWMAEADGRIVWYNRGWYEYTGTTEEQMAGWGWQSVHDPQVLPAVLERWQHSIATGERFEMTFPIRGADGVFRPFLTRIVPVRNAEGRVQRWFGTNTDVTQQQEEEERLATMNAELEARVRQAVAEREAALVRAAHAERLQALGQLAGGVAHDFNNVLQSIQGGAAMISRRVNDPAAVQRFARIILDSTSRGAAVTRRLLAFARRGDLRAEAVDPAELLRGLQEILTPTLGALVTLGIELRTPLPALFADKGQLETVLINLATNARDAMPSGGTLILSATAETATESQEPELPPGAYIRIDVADTGEGMDSTTLSRVFEPFFTTKPAGLGTGLGLPMAKGFAEQSGGALTIKSAPNRGTKVSLWLPQADGARVEPDTAERRDSNADASGRVHVLLVDDDPLVCELLAQQLEELGYSVLVAGSGEEALRLLAAGERVDALITDLTMPEMNGLTLIQAAHAHRPSLPVVLLTGYAGDGAALAVGGALSGAFSLLRKPTTGEQLADRLAALLETRSHTDTEQKG